MKTSIEKKLNHLVKTRPMTEVVYRPYYIQKGIRQKAVLGGITINFTEIFGENQPYKKVFIKTYVQSLKTEEAFLNVAGSHSAVWFENNLLEPETVDNRGACYRIIVSQEKKPVVIERLLDNLQETMTITLSTVYYRGMDAKDYLTHMKLLSPYGENDIEGIGISEPCFMETEEVSIQWNAPWAKECADKSSACKIDFYDLYGEEQGRYAYALTECTQDGTAYIGKQAVTLQKGEQLLIRADRGNCDGKEWELIYEDPENILSIPLLEAKEKLGKFLVIGSFNHLGPEYALTFSKPYFNAEGKQCFWAPPFKNMAVRPYMDSSFFGQWFYALMVGNYGLLKAAEYVGRDDLIQYFMKGMKNLAEYYDYALYEAEKYGEPTFLQRAVELDNLDSIGAMGLCLSECYMRNMDSTVLSVLQRLAYAAKHNIPRFEDGTYHRENTMWADDIFMSLPFLMRMWEITKENWYIEECFKQIRGYKKRLYMEDEHIFSHIYFLEPQTANWVPWGRGNGWIFISMSDLLKKMKLHHVESIYPKEYEEFINTYKSFTDGLIRCQDEEGMLHQVLNDRTSYQETSCTGMFALGICYGIQCNILDWSYVAYAEKALDGLRKKSITEEGVILGVCRGSSCSMNARYYKELGTVDDDDHGTGIVLLAMTALEELYQYRSR